MKRKLIIYETTHFENLSALLELCNPIFEEVTIFIYDDSQQQLLHILRNISLNLKITWHLKKGSSNRQFIQRFFTEVKSGSYSHLHVGTLDHNLLVFSLRLLLAGSLQKSLTLHSINTYKNNRWNSVKDISETIGKVILKRLIKNYRVLAPSMESYFKRTFPAFQCSFIPGNFPKSETPLSHSTKQKFNIVIPGTVEEKRRDYLFVTNFFSKHVHKLCESRCIHLTLAGNAASPYAQTIVKKLLNLRSSKFHVSYYKVPLSQEIYEEAYSSADIIFSPLLIDTIGLRGDSETNGVSHSPGLITDQIYMTTPAIVPNKMKKHLPFANCNWFYNTEDDLFEILDYLLRNPSLLSEGKEALFNETQKKFNINNFITRLQNLFEL